MPTNEYKSTKNKAQDTADEREAKEGNRAGEAAEAARKDYRPPLIGAKNQAESVEASPSPSPAPTPAPTPTPTPAPPKDPKKLPQRADFDDGFRTRAQVDAAYQKALADYARATSQADVLEKP